MYTNYDKNNWMVFIFFAFLFVWYLVLVTKAIEKHFFFTNFHLYTVNFVRIVLIYIISVIFL